MACVHPTRSIHDFTSQQVRCLFILRTSGESKLTLNLHSALTLRKHDTITVTIKTKQLYFVILYVALFFRLYIHDLCVPSHCMIPIVNIW